MKTLFRILCICTFAVLGVVGCDGDECPTCPEPPEHVPDYHLLHAYTGDGYEKWVLTYSTKTGEVIDSTDYGLNIFSNMIFSHSGEYACYTSNYNLDLGTGETWVTNWPDGDTVAYLPGIGAWQICLSQDERYLLLADGNILAILNFPSLTVVYLDSVASRGGALHPTRQIAYVQIDPYRDSVFTLDYSEMPVTINSSQVRDSQGRPLERFSQLLCDETNLILISGNRSEPGYIGIFDIETMQVRRDRLVRSSWLYGGVFHPDGRRLFLVYNNGFDPPFGGGIDVYDLQTDILTPYIRMNEIDIGFGGFLPSGMEFTPDGRYAFIANGGIGLDNGPILEIDITRKEVTRRWDHSSGFARILRLNPKDWSQ